MGLGDLAVKLDHVAGRGGRFHLFDFGFDLQLDRLRERLRGQDLSLDVTDEALEVLAAEGYDPLYGARPVRRTIQHRVETPVARLIVGGALPAGASVKVGVEPGGTIAVSVGERVAAGQPVAA